MINKHPSAVYKIRFSDCDMFGHLNNSRYLDYLIDAREDHLKEAYDFNFETYYKNNFGWVFRGHEIVYLRPAVFNERVVIQSALFHVDLESLRVETVMMDEQRGHIKAVMHSTLIPINLKTGRKEQHDPQLMEWATSLVDHDIAQHGNLHQRIQAMVAELKAKQA
jgi:acyl-CoA thioester hydrolase